jgi:hypothetical protein
MTAFRSFELEAIRLMASDVLSASQLRSLENDAALDTYEYTGSGYFLTVRHSSLPVEEQTLSDPPVVGNVGDIQAGFVVFLGGRRLTLECHTWGPVDVPSDFRERAVVVSTPPVNFVDLRGAT